jgi:putative ABC transport system permease protein
MSTLFTDLRYAVRTLRKTPAFTLTAILTLALGIGASTAIFSVVNAVLLRPLPYPHQDRLVLVWGDMRARHVVDFPIAPGDYPEMRALTGAFEDMAAVSTFRTGLAGDNGEPEQIAVAAATTNFLPMIGATTTAGRAFIEEDGVPDPRPPGAAVGDVPVNAPRVVPRRPASVILSHGFWQRRFGGDPGVVGRTVTLGGNAALIVGVLAPGVELLFPPGTGVERSPDMWTALRMDFASASRNNVFMRVVARLRPGVSRENAQAQLESLAADLRRRFPIKQTADAHFRVESMHEDLVADVRPAVLTLMGAVLFVLLIACANVANLLLVRMSSRTRELAVRAALGGGRWRLVRQMLIESVVLAAVGALLGLGLAQLGIDLLLLLRPETLPRIDAVAIDRVVLGFTIGATLAAALAFGIVPAWRASRPDVMDILRSTGRNASLGGGRVLRSGVVTAEVALSFVLLVGSGLMVRSVIALQQAEPGFRPQGVLTFVAQIQGPHYELAPQRQAFVQRLRERLRALPGVQSVSAGTTVPLDGRVGNGRWGTEEAIADPSRFQQAQFYFVLPGYFETLGTPLVAGRTFTDADNVENVHKIVIDRRLAAKAFPTGSPIGRQILARTGGPDVERFEVIGVVAHQRNITLAADGREAIYFLDGLLGHGRTGVWTVRTSGDLRQLASSVRPAVAAIDPSIPVSEIEPMQAYVDRSQGATRFLLALIGVFAVIAAVLAAIGLYGVLSTTVRQRTAEIGVRMAFGATPRTIFQLMVGQGLRLSAIGIAVGFSAALVLTQAMRSLLVGVEPTDPATFAAIVVLFLMIAAIASWLPARRAARLDPTGALRDE